MEPGAAELYDQALLGILQHVGNVQDFLRVLFGFLYRKTDFYRLLRHPSDRMGFPPGAAQALVLQVTRAGRAGGRRQPGPRESPICARRDPREPPTRTSPPPSLLWPQFPPLVLPQTRLPGLRLLVSRDAGYISSCSWVSSGTPPLWAGSALVAQGLAPQAGGGRLW